MRLNNEFELQLTKEDQVEGENEGTLTLISANQLSMIEVFGSGKKEVKMDNPLCRSISVPSFPCCSIPISCYITCQPIRLSQLMPVHGGAVEDLRYEDMG